MRNSIASFRELPDDGGWDYGANLDYMKELCDYWVNDFDWRAQERKINSFNHHKMHIKGIDMHYIREEGSGPNPMPLMISHVSLGILSFAHPERRKTYRSNLTVVVWIFWTPRAPLWTVADVIHGERSGF